MISLVILLGIWALTFNLGSNPKETERQNNNQTLWLTTSFAISIALFAALNCAEIIFVSSIYTLRQTVFIEGVLSTIYICTTIFYYRRASSYSWRSIFPESNAATGIFLASFFLIAGFSFLISAPHNWDSNVYNLGRLPILLSNSSVTLSPYQVSDTRQAIYPLLHDSLFIPDIAFGNTRGLTGICTLEFFVTSLVLIKLNKLLIQTLSKTNRSLSIDAIKKIREVSELLLMVGIFSSSMQILQSINTKNDLLITYLICQITLCIYISVERQKSPLSNSNSYYPEITSFLTVGLCAVLSISAKSYGIISVIPIFFGVVVWPKNSLYVLKSIRKGIANNSSPSGNNLRDQIYESRRVILISASMIFVGLIFIHHKIDISGMWKNHGPEIAAVSSRWTNTHGPILERVSNGLLNSQRIFFQGLLFPFTSTKIYYPLSDGINTQWLNSYIPTWLSSSKGVVEAYQLHYGSNLDIAYPLIGTQLIILFGCFGLLFRHMKPLMRFYWFHGLSSFSIVGIICFALYYNNYLSRYLGPAYIPILPICSISTGYLFYKFSKPWTAYSTVRRSIKIFVTASFCIFPIMGVFAVSQYVSTSEGLPQDQTAYYENYLLSQTNIGGTIEIQDHINHLKNYKYVARTLCAESGSHVFIPLIKSIQNNSFNGSNLQVTNKKNCPALVQGNVATTHKGRDYVNIPNLK